MSKLIHSHAFDSQQDLIHALQMTEIIAAGSGLNAEHKARIVTATSEILRNSFQYAGSGTIAFSLYFEDSDAYLSVKISDKGQGVRNLEQVLSCESSTENFIGQGISKAQKLVDIFEIISHPESGTEVTLYKKLADTDYATRCEDWVSGAIQMQTDPPTIPLFDQSHSGLRRQFVG